MNKKLSTAGIVLALFVAFGLAGAMDYEDAVAAQALYCDNVKSGVWPDYEQTYVSECEKTHGPKKVAKNFR